MRSAPHLFNEDARLASLAEYDLLEGETAVDLEEIVRIGARLFDVPIVLVSIVERARQVFKAKTGIDVCETARDISFCAHALTLPPQDMLIVPDALLDIRFADNPLVTGEPHIRFYAGVPLRSPTGHALGTLCIIDTRPRSGLSTAEQDDLKNLASLVLDKLEMRRLAVAGAVNQSRFENIAATSPDGIICADREGKITFWNEAAERLFGYPAETAIGDSIELIMPQRLRGGLKEVTSGGQSPPVGQTVELQAVRRDGTEFPIELSLSMWGDRDNARFGAIIRDLSRRRANEERLFTLAHLDTLTGLPNRAVLMQRLEDCTQRCERAAVLMLDLDQFKGVNDTLGHGVGDAVLRQVAARIQENLRSLDTGARLGGDEFALLVPDYPSEESVTDLADRLIFAMAAPMPVEGRLIHVSASVGIALCPEDGRTAEELLSAADLALYQAKAEGRDCRRFFTPRLREVAVSRRAFESELRRAIEGNEFELHYQPQVRIRDGALLGVEALLRWRHPREGLLAPDRFLSSIESGLLAAEVGRWSIEQACADAMALRRTHPDLIMGVNLFGAQFRTGRLASEVSEILERTGLPPAALELEITENIILRHDDTMLGPLRQLRAMGVGIAFDDFGTGFASLSLLKRYPVTRLKIDRSFVRDVVEDKGDAAIVTATVYIASNLGIEVIAEGVETEAQRDMLLTCGCTVLQGYLYGKPMPLAELMPYAAEDARSFA